MTILRAFLLCFSLLTLSFSALAASAKNVDKVLDALHKAAEQARFNDYFAYYASDAIFIGTDASETWTLEQFKRYAKPVFESGDGWTYHPQTRHIYFSKEGNVAWFDERLKHASYGVTRGTGVLQKYDGKWKIQQYHLAIPIPNALARQITQAIKQHETQ